MSLVNFSQKMQSRPNLPQEARGKNTSFAALFQTADNSDEDWQYEDPNADSENEYQVVKVHQTKKHTKRKEKKKTKEVNHLDNKNNSQKENNTLNPNRTVCNKWLKSDSSKRCTLTYLYARHTVFDRVPTWLTNARWQKELKVPESMRCLQHTPKLQQLLKDHTLLRFFNFVWGKNWFTINNLTNKQGRLLDKE
jgi:hypothetical protein